MEKKLRESFYSKYFPKHTGQRKFTPSWKLWKLFNFNSPQFRRFLFIIRKLGRKKKIQKQICV